MGGHFLATRKGYRPDLVDEVGLCNIEYARVRVIIDPGQWAALQPGRYEIYAALVDLGLHVTGALVVDVTARDIQLHLPQRPVPGPPAQPW